MSRQHGLRDRDRVIWEDVTGRVRGGVVERATMVPEVHVPDATGLEGSVYAVDPDAVLVVLPRNEETSEVPW